MSYSSAVLTSAAAVSVPCVSGGGESSSGPIVGPGPGRRARLPETTDEPASEPPEPGERPSRSEPSRSRSRRLGAHDLAAGPGRERLPEPGRGDVREPAARILADTHRSAGRGVECPRIDLIGHKPGRAVEHQDVAAAGGEAGGRVPGRREGAGGHAL